MRQVDNAQRLDALKSQITSAEGKAGMHLVAAARAEYVLVADRYLSVAQKNQELCKTVLLS